MKSHQKGLLWAGVVSLLLPALPFVRLAMLPLQYLNTHLHELCHALSALAFGGQVKHILVFANGSGVTPVSTPGGLSVLFVASAGYVGASCIGALMILYGRTASGARTVLYTVAAALTLSMVLWVRGDIVGVLSGIFWVTALWALSRYLKNEWLVFAAQFVGLQQCLNAAQSLYVLLRISSYGEPYSDAGILQGASGVPALVWATLWCLFSLLMMGLTLRKAWNQSISPTVSPR